MREDRSILDSVAEDESRRDSRASARAIAHRVGDYLDSHPRDRAAHPARRSNRPTLDPSRAWTRRSASRTCSRITSRCCSTCWRLAYQADITRVFTFMLARELSQPHLSADRRARAASCRVAPSEQPRDDRRTREDQHLPLRRCSRSSSRSCGTRRTATARCSIIR